MYGSPNGFTIIEVLVVVSLIALLSTVILPDFKSLLLDYKLITAARQMAQDLRLTQHKAISEGIPWKVIFQPSSNSYMIIQGFKSWKQVSLPDGIKFDFVGFPSKTLTFYPSGAPVPAGSVKITNNVRSLYIIASVATGRIRISEALTQGDLSVLRSKRVYFD
ncbi:MAG: GspH/FimT family pseudopilin [Tepidanaerobacteraceae bacterium]